MTTELPGLTVDVAPPPVLPPPLRTDVAGFIGATRRGPIGTPVRVESLNDYRDVFGDLDPAAATSYAVRGYYENGGELAWVTRVAGATTTATAAWSVAGQDGFLPVTAYQVIASSPGSWAEGGQVTVWYRSGSLAGSAEVDVRVAIPGETVEVFTRIPAKQIAERMADSHLIRLVPMLGQDGAAGAGSPARQGKVSQLSLSRDPNAAPDSAPGVDDYLAAVQALADQTEVAIVAAPDLGGHLTSDDDRRDVVSALLSTAASQLDRLVLIDVPPGPAGHTLDPVGALAWSTAVLPAVTDPELRRAAAVYYPGLLVPDPLGGLTAPLRVLPPSGHVAGVISRLDRERGAFSTPGQRGSRRGGRPRSRADRARAGRGLRGEPESAALYARAWPAGLGRPHARCHPRSCLLHRAPAPAAPAGARRAPGRRRARLRRQRAGAEAEPGPRGDLRAAGGVPSRGTGRDPAARGIPGGL